MAKEIERKGLAVALITSLTQIGLAVGANRIVGALGIPHPLGNPSLPPEAEKRGRRRLLELALDSLQQSVSRPTVFSLGQ